METPASYSINRTYFVAMYATQNQRLADSKAFPSGTHIQFGALPQILQGWVTNAALDVGESFPNAHYVAILQDGDQWKAYKNGGGVDG